MKRLFAIPALSLLLILFACTKPNLELIIELPDNQTLTAYVGDESVNFDEVVVKDETGEILTADISLNGTYDLNHVGFYEATLTIVVGDDRIKEVPVYIQVLEKTCDLFPEMPQCPVYVAGFSLDEQSQAVDTIFVGDFIKVNWIITPSNADNQEVILTSSDENIATVSNYGYVFGQNEGTVTITFRTVDGGYTITKNYTIRKPTCEEDPLQEECIYLFLSDDSRLTTLEDPTFDLFTYQNNKAYYEIFVRRFADSDGDGTGDFIGIKDNIDYIDQLGMGGIWLMPIFPSSSDHGYDVNDYFGVNPQYGTMSEFQDLLLTADQADIDIIIDLVINHMGAHNPIFQDVLQNGIYSEFYDWFTWTDEDSGRQNERGSWGQTIWWNPSNRTWLRTSPYTIHPSLSDKYYFGTFSDWMPDLNLENPEVISYIHLIASYWIDKGVHGFRMDATSHLYALHEYPDISDRNSANISFLSEFSDYVHSLNQDAFIVIEAWESSDVYIPYHSADVSVFNFQGQYWVKDAVLDRLFTDIGDALDMLYDGMNQANINYIDSLFISNHDMDRVAKVVTDDNELRQAATILFTTKSTPFIYYGDELGMLGTRNNMVFGSYYPGLYPQYEDRYIDDVTEQLSDPDSLLNTYIKLGELRNDHVSLLNGEFIPYKSQNLEGYLRYYDDGTKQELVLVLFNFSDSITYPIPDDITSYEILFATQKTNIGGISPNSVMILQLPIELYALLSNQ